MEIILNWIVALATLTIAIYAAIQARAAQKAADAAWLNAQAVINSERAWILLDDVGPKMGEAIFKYPYKTKVPLSAQFKNSGKTPAWIIDWCCKFVHADVAEFQGPMDYGNAKPGGDYAVAPNGGLFPVFPEGGDPIISSSDLDHIRSEQKSMVLYGRVRYRDVFETKDPPIRESYFCVRLLVYTYGPATSWQLAGPSGANRCT